MSKSSADRYDTCSAFADDLTHCLNENPSWRPMSRGMAGTMATVVETAPQMSRRQTGQSVAMTRGTQSPATRAGTQSPAAAPPKTPAAIEETPPERKSPIGLVLAIVGGLLVAGLGGWYVVGLMSQSNSEPEAGQVAEMPAGIQRERPSPASAPASPVRPSGAATGGPPPETTTPASQPGTPASTAGASTGGKPAAVEIETIPAGAKISIDQGATTCVSPCPLEIASGRHVVEAVLAGHRPAYRIFFTPQEPKVSIKLEKPMGILSLKSTPPDAAIVLNGQAQAQKTPVTLNLPAGKYKVELKKPGFTDYVGDLEVRDQITSSFEVFLTPGG
jgi:hypothetical protein